MTTPQLTIYDFDQVTVGVGNIIVDGFAEGDGVMIEPDAAVFVKVTGADGKTTRTKTLNKGAKVTITLAQSSLTNDKFSALITADAEAPNGAGVVPLYIRDKSGRGLWTAAQCWLSELPSVDLKNEVTSRVWVIECAKLVRFDGGN